MAFLAAALSAAFRALYLFIQFEISVVRVPASRVIADLINKVCGSVSWGESNCTSAIPIAPKVPGEPMFSLLHSVLSSQFSALSS